jgi:hypothetical protein
MANRSPDCLYEDYGSVEDREKLQTIIKDIQTTALTVIRRNSDRQEELQKTIALQSEHYSSSHTCLYSDEEPRWLIAEQGYPEEQAQVVLFDDREFKVTSAKDLTGIVPT